MSNQLIQLVKTLTRNEKRYINLNLKTYSFDENGNQLLSDFNRIEKQLSLKKLKEELKLEGNATRLFYKILDILFSLHKDLLYENENSNRLIKRSQILFHKGFYSEGVKQLNKVIYTGFSYSYLIKIEAIELKIKAAIKFVDVDYLKNDFEEDKVLLAQYSNYYFNLVEYESMWAIMKVESTTLYFFGENDEFKKQYQDLLSDEARAYSPNAKIYFNQVNAFLAIKKGDLESAYKYTVRSKDIFDSYPEIRENKLNEYLRVVRNICIVFTHQKKFNEAEVILNDIESVIMNSKMRKQVSLQNDIYTLMVLLRMDLIISNYSIDANKDKINKFEEQLEEHEDKLAADEKCTSFYYLCLMNTVLGNYRKALRLVNHAIKHSTTVRKDINHVSLILEMVIHFYLGNSELLFSKLNSYKRFIEKNGVIFSFEHKLPKLLSTLFNAPNEQRHYNKIRQEIEQSLLDEKKLVYRPFIPLFYLKQV
ncbi:MAG: hypothetical protein ACK50A_06415 [Sphingobacteriaceae bacterium]